MIINRRIWKLQFKIPYIMLQKQELTSDLSEQDQLHKDVPVSCRPRFMNQVISRHKNRIRTDAKKRTRQHKYQEETRNEIQNLQKNVQFNIILEQQGLEKKTTFLHGNKIEGTWKNGNLHGHVIIEYETGEYFEGQYVNGYKVSGLVRFKDGTQYNGGFLRDTFHGKGDLKDPTGRIISCNWLEGQPQKKAQIFYPGGDIYYGQIKNLKKHGKGYLFFKNGCKYQGNFVNGTITGHGKYFQKEGVKIAEGIWQNGVLQIEQNVKQILVEALKMVKGHIIQLDVDPPFPRKRNENSIVV